LTQSGKPRPDYCFQFLDISSLNSLAGLLGGRPLTLFKIPLSLAIFRRGLVPDFRPTGRYPCCRHGCIAKPARFHRLNSYQLYLQRAKAHGHDIYDWLQAEAELVHGHSPSLSNEP
jgi:hypothetical protein